MTKLLNDIINNKKNKKSDNDQSFVNKEQNTFENNYDDLDEEFGVFKITILGIGGAGCNAVCHIAKTRGEWDKNVKLCGVNTDIGSLRLINKYVDTFLLGKKQFAGIGSGGIASNGKIAAESDKEKISELIKGSHILFLIAGLGKGTGSGATPIIAQIAKELDICTVAIVCTPSIQAEGKKVYENAHQNFNILTKSTTCFTTISNDKILTNSSNRLSLIAAFKKANEEISTIVQTIVDIINIPVEINIDFADVRNFLQDSDSFVVSNFELKNSDYSYETLKAKVNENIENSFSGIKLNNINKILANIFVSDDTSVSITSDINRLFTEKTGNDDISVVNGMQYEEKKEYLKFQFLISSEASGIDQPQGINIIGKTYSSKSNDFITSDDLKTLKLNVKKVEEENFTKFQSFDYDANEVEPSGKIHNTTFLNTEQHAKIINEWQIDEEEEKN